MLGCLIGLVTHRSLQLPLASVLLHRKFLIVLPLPERSVLLFDFYTSVERVTQLQHRGCTAHSGGRAQQRLQLEEE